MNNGRKWKEWGRREGGLEGAKIKWNIRTEMEGW